MGLYIHLTVNFKDISNEDWETAWHESLDIFKKFPLPLSRHIHHPTPPSVKKSD